MRILFDHQTFSLQNFGGISRYYTELIREINQTPGNQACLSAIVSNNVHLREAGIKVNAFFPGWNFQRKTSLIYRINQLYGTAQLRAKAYDVFHATYYDPYFLPHLDRRPFVVTFMDMIHEKFVQQFPGLDDGGLITEQKRVLAQRAARIIAISESTKRDVVELLDVDPAKIDVIYLGSSLRAMPVQPDTGPKPAPYLLFVGRRERYKNFEGLLRAVHPLLRQHKLNLVCAGGDPFTPEERALIDEVDANDWVEQRPIDDKSLQTLYQRAVAFVFPSLYEGFGIPILEAFACGCPCIVSNSSSLPEVAGDAALYIDPAMPDSIAEAVNQLINNAQLRQTLINRGREQLSRFSWQRTVTETLNVYQSVA